VAIAATSMSTTCILVALIVDAASSCTRSGTTVTNALLFALFVFIAETYPLLHAKAAYFPTRSTVVCDFGALLTKQCTRGIILHAAVRVSMALAFMRIPPWGQKRRGWICHRIGCNSNWLDVAKPTIRE
jgi:hypothetical protein